MLHNPGSHNRLAVNRPRPISADQVRTAADAAGLLVDVRHDPTCETRQGGRWCSCQPAIIIRNAPCAGKAVR